MQYYIYTIFALKSLNLFLPRLFIFAETSARIDSVDSRRVTVDANPGRLWGHGGAPPGELISNHVKINTQNYNRFESNYYIDGRKNSSKPKNNGWKTYY